MECDEGTGEIMTGRILSQKVTDNFNIEFKIARGAKFIGWKAYSKSTDGTLTELSSEYFTFTSIPTEDNSGIYKTSAKFLKKADAITIKPYVQILPAVKNYSPAQNSDGSYANMPVVITFNMPMEDEVTQRNESIFTYSNISLTYEGESLTNYFDAPEFNSEKTVLTLKPHGRDLRDFIIGENRPNIDVKVQLSDRISVTRDGISLPLSQDENSTFMVRYKASIEEIVPAKYDFFATRDEISLEQSATQNKFTQNALGTFTDTEIFQNRTNGTIWIYGRYYDADSGVKTVRLTEKRTNNKDGSAAVAAVKTHDFTSDTENAQFVDDGNGNTTFCIKYDLESDDGAILLGVTVLDACGNAAAEQTFTAIKDSVIDLSNVEMYNLGWNFSHSRGPFTESEGSATDITVDEYIEYVKTLHIDSINRQIYNNCKASETDLTVSLSYKNTNGMIVNADMVYTDRWTYKLEDVETASGLAITLTVSDSFGTSAPQEFYIPAKPLVSYAKFKEFIASTNRERYGIYFDTSSIYTKFGYISSADSYSEYHLGGVDSSTITVEDNINSTAVYCNFFTANGRLAGELTDAIIPSSLVIQEDSNLTPVTVGSASLIARKDDGHYVDITLDTSTYNPWSVYDSIIAIYNSGTDDSLFTATKFEK
ncbi:MAG: hypothetical protein II461_09145, partial [Treponema sp.]|nr:hypothetical protein [Treponema sp.]